MSAPRRAHSYSTAHDQPGVMKEPLREYQLPRGVATD
ncbi:hypothetical protein FHX37_4472 [Haloactinospora alba]|uniref:Uncharacterized protein n=1 Tax=Haloactinospora alba TaxID=405555 RepID=A0A543N7F7_9ACTN|nr:hypothetical protein FHX37_4472 [Haloactinospora alba]